MSRAILLVGFGLRAREWAAAVHGRRDCRLAGVVDPDPAARSAASAPGWDSLAGALGAAEADFAIIASPPELHAEQAIACLGSGLGVLVEKPLALSLEDAAAIADSADAAGRVAIAGHNFRHRPLERRIRGAIASGAIGRLRFASVVTVRPPRPGSIDHAPLWDLGTHHIDLLRVRFGAAPDSVEARFTETADGVTYSVALRWDGGASAQYVLREAGTVYHHAEWLEGSEGGLRVVDGKISVVCATRRPRRLRVGRGPAPERVLLDAMLEGGGAGADARDALGTIATLEAVVRSMATGGRETVDLRGAALAR